MYYKYISWYTTLFINCLINSNGLDILLYFDSILNKLTPDNFDRLSNQLVHVGITNKEILSIVIKLVSCHIELSSFMIYTSSYAVNLRTFYFRSMTKQHQKPSIVLYTPNCVADYRKKHRNSMRSPIPMYDFCFIRKMLFNVFYNVSIIFISSHSVSFYYTFARMNFTAEPKLALVM